MNKKTLTALIIAAVVLVGGGVSFALVQNSNDKKVAENATMMKKDEATKMAKEKEDAAMMKESETEAMKKTETGGAMAMVKGSYTDYDSAKLANAEKGKVVLFFHAPWCPTCREADKNFNASSTPEGLTLLKADYDSSQDLKKKYGVTYQHTFVQVDKDGNQIKKWNSSTSYASIQKELN